MSAALFIEQQNAVMDQIVGKLESSYTQAQTSVEQNWAYFGVYNVKQATLANLARLRPQLDALAGPRRKEVMGGVRTFDSWVALARDIHSDMKFQVSIIDDWSFDGVVSAIASNTAGDVEKAVREAAPYAALGSGIVLLVLGFVGFVYLKALRVA